MFNDQLECYEAIANELFKIIPDQWDSVEIEAKLVGESSIELIALYHNSYGKHSIFDCKMLPRYFFELRKLVSPDNRGYYKACTFKLYSNGEYDTDFEY